MEICGSAWEFFEELIPDKFIPDLLDLVRRAWQKVTVFENLEKPLEPRISALLKDRMIEENDLHLDFGFTFNLEEPVTDPISGIQIKRTDIEIGHRACKIKGQKPYFVFEAKRLRVPLHNGKHSAGNSEYIEELKTFISDAKKIAPAHCGMLGYVMDGQVTKAHQSLQKSIKKLSVDLGMASGTGMEKCPDFPNTPHDQTVHDSPQRGKLPIRHLLLAVTK